MNGSRFYVKKVLLTAIESIIAHKEVIVYGMTMTVLPLIQADIEIGEETFRINRFIIETMP